MNALSFIKYAIIDGLKACYPAPKISVPNEVVEDLDDSVNKETLKNKVPVDYVCKGLCSKCKYNERN